MINTDLSKYSGFQLNLNNKNVIKGSVSLDNKKGHVLLMTVEKPEHKVVMDSREVKNGKQVSNTIFEFTNKYGQ